jgi:hypothetical protein
MVLLWTAPGDAPCSCGFVGLLACAVTVMAPAQSSQVHKIVVAWVADVVDLEVLNASAERAISGDRPAAGLVPTQYGLDAGRPVDWAWRTAPLLRCLHSVAWVGLNSAGHDGSVLVGMRSLVGCLFTWSVAGGCAGCPLVEMIAKPLHLGGAHVLAEVGDAPVEVTGDTPLDLDGAGAFGPRSVTSSASNARLPPCRKGWLRVLLPLAITSFHG